MTESNQAIAEEKINKPLEQCEIGEPSPPLKPKDVEVIGFQFPEEKKRPMKIITKHPDREETLDLTGVKYEKDNKVITTGLWVERDVEDSDKIKYNNAVVALMKHYDVKMLKDLIGRKLETTNKENGFLVIRAY